MPSWISALALVAAFQAPEAPAALRAEPADWARRPSAVDLARFYPERATREKVSGEVTLACSVDRSGALSRCSVSDETPAGYGFGEAALKLAETYGMCPERAIDWASTDRQVLLPVTFRPPNDAAPRAAPSPPGEWLPRPTPYRRLPRGVKA